MSAVRFALLLMAVFAVAIINVDAAYRKPPFNGSIFGKRANSVSGEKNLRLHLNTFRNNLR